MGFAYVYSVIARNTALFHTGTLHMSVRMKLQCILTVTYVNIFQKQISTHFLETQKQTRVFAPHFPENKHVFLHPKLHLDFVTNPTVLACLHCVLPMFTLCLHSCEIILRIIYGLNFPTISRPNCTSICSENMLFCLV